MASRKGRISRHGVIRDNHAPVKVRISGSVSRRPDIKQISPLNGNAIYAGSIGPQVTNGNGDTISMGPIIDKVNTLKGKSVSIKESKLEISTVEQKKVQAALKKVYDIAAKRKSESNPAYLTRRILKSATRKAFTQAAEETMDVMGYNLVAKDGWLVKVYKDGRFEKISKLKSVPRPPSGKFFD